TACLPAPKRRIASRPPPEACRRRHKLIAFIGCFVDNASETNTCLFSSYHLLGGKPPMLGTHARWLVLTALVALLLSDGRLSAADPPNTTPPKVDVLFLPNPADVQSLAIYPAKIALKGGDDAQQLILTATLAGGKLQDLSGDAKYEPADPKVIRVSTA